jgi:hypothetical protein
MKPGDLDNRFDYHPPSPLLAIDHGKVRDAIKDAAAQIERIHPHDCREKSLAFTALEEAMFWGNAALARHDNDGTPR